MIENPPSQSTPFGGKIIERRISTERPFSSSTTVFRYTVGGELCNIEHNFVLEPGIVGTSKFKD